jgi:4-hydroxy-3-methylbut-2-enyl diphosphate reductase IspH
LTAGASTPDWIIIEIYNKLSKIAGIDIPSMQSIDEIPSY